MATSADADHLHETVLCIYPISLANSSCLVQNYCLGGICEALCD